MRLQQFIRELLELERDNGDILIEFEDYDEDGIELYWPISTIRLSEDKKVVILQ